MSKEVFQKIIKEKFEKTGSLYLWGCYLRNVPEEVGEMTWLTSLDLHSNQISDLSFLKKLSNLQSLNLSANKITDISWLKHLFNLRTLDLRSNNISEVRSLENLSNLRNLNISHNNIRDIKFIENLFRIKELNISNNHLADIKIGKKLSRINSLDLSNNRISNIEFIEKMTNLHTLILGKNNIDNISSITHLTDLFFLDLRSNQIQEIAALENLTNLLTLNLSLNLISDIYTLGQLNNLQELLLGSNNIIDTSYLKKLKNLHTIDISSNKIKDYGFLDSLPSLKSINLRNNNIEDIRFLEKHKNLQEINLNNNKIIDLSPLKNLINKKRLAISVEGLGGNIRVKNNPLGIPPIEIVKNGREAILRYFEDIKESGEDFLYEAKLLIVGEPGAGKTSLYRKIKNEVLPLPTKDETTRGIDIHEYYFITKQNTKFRINLWDFGGQVIMYFAHQFFLTSNSLYVLVTDGRQENSNFKYWLQVVELLGKNSRVLLVQNEVGGRVHKTNLDDYVDRFKNIVFTKSLNLDRDIPKIKSLRKQIEKEIQEIPSIGKALPKRWIQVRERINEASKKNDIIDCAQYFEICKKEGIVDKEKALKLSEDLHSLGVFLHFQKDPVLKNFLILDNSWATGAVYSLVDNETIKTKNKGQFTENEFGKIWDQEKFYDKHFEIIQLLKNFNIVYEIPHTKIKKYIIPQLLPEKQPDYMWNTSENVVLFFKYDFMPKGIISNFVVRMHRYIENQQLVWRYGVVINRNETKAEVIENELEQTIYIKIKGKYPQDFMTIIVEEIDKINEKFKDIEVDKYVPCNCNKCLSSNDPSFFVYAELKDRIRVGNPNALKIPCKNLQYDFVDVRPLMESVVVMDAQIEALKREVDEKEPKPKKIFISYSKADKVAKERIKTVLHPLAREGKINIWDDSHLIPAEDWDEDIRIQLQESDVILCLVTIDFLGTDYIWKTELELAKTNNITILPVIVDFCNWTEHEVLSKRSALPKKGVPIKSQEWETEAQAWTEVEKGIRRLME
jgi:Leucine-rich repeat (LRR) protein/GTPase SAR1 family protein